MDLCVETEHGCEHICESSPGSFHCFCLPGYTLNDDGKTCTGERHDEDYENNNRDKMIRITIALINVHACVFGSHRLVRRRQTRL